MGLVALRLLMPQMRTTAAETMGKRGTEGDREAHKKLTRPIADCNALMLMYVSKPAVEVDDSETGTYVCIATFFIMPITPNQINVTVG